jgi:iron complex transport system permease protein
MADLTLSRPRQGVARWPRVLGVWGALLLALGAAFLLSLMLGSVRIPLDDVARVLLGGEAHRASWNDIIWLFRVPKAITAVLAGAALAAAGLQLQTLFRNPLADPYILGVSSGASLGVAVVILGSGAGGGLLLSQGLGLFGELTLAVAASLGALLVLGVVLVLMRWTHNMLALLILGLMLGYLTSALVSLMVYTSRPERIQAFSLWSAGSFSGVTWSQLGAFAPVVILALGVAMLMPKTLNALLLGEAYARSMGVNVKVARFGIILSASLLAGATTAFCGPVGFIGVAVPHVTRALLGTSDHRQVVPASLAFGALLALIADLIAQVPGSQAVLPLNTVTALFGVPVVAWVLLRSRNPIA